MKKLNWDSVLYNLFTWIPALIIFAIVLTIGRCMSDEANDTRKRAMANDAELAKYGTDRCLARELYITCINANGISNMQSNAYKQEIDQEDTIDACASSANRLSNRLISSTPINCR